MQAASTESVVNGVEPRGALPMPPTDSGETDSNCGARATRCQAKARGAVCVVCVGGRGLSHSALLPDTRVDGATHSLCVRGGY